MNNISYKNKWNAGVVQMHMEPPPIPLIKINPNDNLNKDFFEIKFLRYPTSENSYLYEFKMNLFDNGDPEEFCWSCITSTWLLRRQGRWRRAQGKKSAYVSTWVVIMSVWLFVCGCGKYGTPYCVIHYYGVIILLYPVNMIFKNRSMRCRMRKPRGLKLRHYAAC